MRKYVPRFEKDDNELLIMDNVFEAEDCVAYADRHNLNVLYKNTTSASAVEVMNMFYKKGYTVAFIEKKRTAPDGTKIQPDIYVLFTRNGNKSDKDESEQEK